MQRVVNGHFSNPNSTRNLIGITPAEFELMIRVIQERIKGLDYLFAMPAASRTAAFQKMAEQLGEVDLTVAYKTMQELEEYYTNDYNLMYKILNDINQPYPGTLDRLN